jgi:hypothetical protein
MPRPIAELITTTAADLRAGRESWRVLTLFWSCAIAITVVVQHLL